MSSRDIVRSSIVGFGVVLFQFIMIQIVALIVSFSFPQLGDFPETQPIPFLLALGLAFSIGTYFAGWIALKLHWLKILPKYMSRLETTVIGAYIPLVILLIFYHPIQPGNPFFYISMLTSIIGFYIPGAIGKAKNP